MPMEPNQESIALDKLDFDILKALQEDGRKSFTDIARELEVSVGTIRNRYNRLVENKLLYVYGRVDPNNIGFNAYAHIYIAVRPASLIESVAKTIAEYPEVSFLALVSGDFELELNVMCRDNNHLLQLMNDRLHRLDGVYQTRTTMYLKLYKLAQPDLDLVEPSSSR